MNRIINPNTVPPGGAFIYVQPESGMEFRHHTMVHLMEMVKKHRIANNYPIGIGFEQEIVDYICLHQEGICEDVIPPKPLSKLQLAINFTKAMAGWMKQGFRVVTPDQFNARRDTCLACPYWGGETNFGYGRCGKCGCSGLKLFTKTTPDGNDCPDKRWPVIS